MASGYWMLPFFAVLLLVYLDAAVCGDATTTSRNHVIGGDIFASPCAQPAVPSSSPHPRAIRHNSVAATKASTSKQQPWTLPARHSTQGAVAANEESSRGICSSLGTSGLWIRFRAAVAHFYRKHPHLVLFLVTSEAVARIARWCHRRQPRQNFKHVKPKGDCDGLAVIHVIFGSNLVVFFAWKVAQRQRTETNVRFLLKHFVLPASPDERRLRPHTYLSSTFSHTRSTHLVSNMSSLYIFGPKVFRALNGVRRFSYFYVASAYASGIADKWILEKVPLDSLRVFQLILVGVMEEAMKDARTHSEVIDSIEIHVPDYRKIDSRAGRVSSSLGTEPDRRLDSLGASGALAAVTSYRCLRFPRDRISLPSDGGERIEMPAAVIAACYFVEDFLQLRTGTTIGHGAHLGGYVFGGVVFLILDVISPLWATGRMQIRSWREKRQRRRRRRRRRRGT